MAAVVEQLCIKSSEVIAENGDYCKIEQGKIYTTTTPRSDSDTVTVFSNFWVRAPKDNFVRREPRIYEY